MCINIVGNYLYTYIGGEKMYIWMAKLYIYNYDKPAYAIVKMDTKLSLHICMHMLYFEKPKWMKM